MNGKKELEKHFYLLRGLPGSGKSTLAKSLRGKQGQIFSTDDFWDLGNGFDCNRLTEAHQWNQRRSYAAFDARIPVIIIDNTNLTLKEMRGYLNHINKALDEGYTVSIREAETDWALDANACFNKTTHNVPLKTIELMLGKYKRDIKVKDIICQHK